MASFLIRDIPESVKSSLRLRAAQNGRSMAAEAREILQNGLKQSSPVRRNLATEIRRLVEPWGGIELSLPPREPVRTPPDFSE
jgi:antitoxin FitA